MPFHVTHRRDGKFEPRGLRNYFEYRDLGIKRATKGKVVAHVIRARPGKAPHGEWHYHDVNVQFVYVLKGWVDLEFEDGQKLRVQGGESLYIPGGLLHNETATSETLEILEVSVPADMGTVACEAPQRSGSAE